MGVLKDTAHEKRAVSEECSRRRNRKGEFESRVCAEESSRRGGESEVVLRREIKKRRV